MIGNETTYFSEDFIRFIVKSSGGFLSSDELDKLFLLFQTEASKYNFNVSAENNLRRIIESSFDKIAFIRDALYYSHHTEIVFAIICNGNYLTDIVVRNPEYLYQLFDSDYLRQKVDAFAIRKEVALFSSRYKKFETVVKMLKLFKRRMILKIGLNDILRNDSFEDTVDQLSILARETLSFLFDYAYRKTLDKYGIKSTRHSYVLASLGKLGGGELNYSSDTDLILFFDKRGKTGKEKMDYFELLNEATQKFIQAASEPTGEGYLYRIDFRLRPDGKNSPLARALEDYITYYETRAEEWERQMLIKLDFLSGDKKLFKRFKDFTEHYVFPLSLKASPQAEIASMKRNIERNLTSENNIKLFSGGIRDIEFSVQALQLLNGGRRPELRGGNTLNAIMSLNSADLLSESESKIFSSAYIFYRKIEHYRQLLNDVQTHDLPNDDEQLKSLSLYMGFRNPADFLSTLSETRKKVRAIFESIAGTETATAVTKFDKINFSDKLRARKNLAFIRSGVDLAGVKKFDRRTSKKFELVEESLFDFLSESAFPDLALENLTKVIGASPKVEVWFGEFRNRKFFREILTLFTVSEKAVETLLALPHLGETLLTRKAFITGLEKEFDALTTDEMRFILSVQFSLKLIDHSRFSEILTGFIDYKINTVAQKFDGNFFIAAMGSYGAREMGLESDVDLIFAADEISDNEKAQQKFQNILTELKKELSPIEVDCRLRPEGNRSPLVVEARRYENYFAERARPWEFQAFLKFRFVCGKKELFKRVKKYFNREFAKLNAKAVKRETLAMRKTLIRQSAFGTTSTDVKKSAGTLIDIDFILFLKILSIKENITEISSAETLSKIYFLSKHEALNKEETKIIQDAFTFFKTVEFAVQNLFASRAAIIPANENKKLKLISFFGFNSLPDFDVFLKEKSNSIREIFDSVVTKNSYS